MLRVAEVYLRSPFHRSNRALNLLSLLRSLIRPSPHPLIIAGRKQTCLTPEPVWKDGLTDWQTDSLANIYHHISKNIESKFWNIYLQLLLVKFFNFGTWAFRLNISVYIKNTYNRPRVCFLIFIKSNCILNNISKFSTFGIHQDFVPPWQIGNLGLQLKKNFPTLFQNFDSMFLLVWWHMFAGRFSQ